MKRIFVWDGGVRLFHWALVLCFALSTWTAFQDKSGFWGVLHIWSGYAIAGLLAWRFLWGVWGSETALLGPLVDRLSGLETYLKSVMTKTPEKWVGHNPAGALSVLLMLSLLGLQVILGLMASDDLLFRGPFADFGGRLPLPVTEIHEWLGYGLMALVAGHIGAVFFYHIVLKNNLIKAMITGYQAISGSERPPVMRGWRWAVVFAVPALLLFLWLFQLPLD